MRGGDRSDAEKPSTPGDDGDAEDRADDRRADRHRRCVRVPVRAPCARRLPPPSTRPATPARRRRASPWSRASGAPASARTSETPTSARRRSAIATTTNDADDADADVRQRSPRCPGATRPAARRRPGVNADSSTAVTVATTAAPTPIARPRPNARSRSCALGEPEPAQHIVVVGISVPEARERLAEQEQRDAPRRRSRAVAARSPRTSRPRCTGAPSSMLVARHDLRGRRRARSSSRLNAGNAARAVAQPDREHLERVGMRRGVRRRQERQRRQAAGDRREATLHRDDADDPDRRRRTAPVASASRSGERRGASDCPGLDTEAVGGEERQRDLVRRRSAAGRAARGHRSAWCRSGRRRSANGEMSLSTIGLPAARRPRRVVVRQLRRVGDLGQVRDLVEVELAVDGVGRAAVRSARCRTRACPRRNRSYAVCVRSGAGERGDRRRRSSLPTSSATPSQERQCARASTRSRSQTAFTPGSSPARAVPDKVAGAPAAAHTCTPKLRQR